MNNELRLLDAITAAQAQTLQDIDAPTIFEGLLEVLLELTESEYGFIAEVLWTEKGAPYLKTRAITDITWNEETKRFYDENAPSGMEFHNLDTLFGAALVTEQPVFANDTANDPRSGGIPSGHPPLNCFMGIPFRTSGEMVGMVGVANRPGGYDEQLAERIKPLLATCGNIVFGRKAKLDRDKILQSLREEEARHRAIVEGAIDSILTVTEEGVIEAANPAAERLFGYPADELIGRHVGMVIAEPWRSDRDRDRKRYMETGQSSYVGAKREIECRKKDGTVFPVELAISEVQLVGRKIYTGLARDLTDKKKSEDVTRNAYAELAKSHDDMLAILDQLAVGTVMIDADGIVSFISQSCRFADGFCEEDCLGQPWDEFCLFDEVSVGVLRQIIGLPQAERKRQFLKWEGENGRQRWFEVDVQDDPRRTGGLILYLYDQSEIYSLRDELERARYGEIVGESPAMIELYGLIETVADGEWTVLIEGETGVGKELVAHSIHTASPRKDGSFIAVNCAGLSESLLASQLFGHKKGSFTGAISDQEGFFEAAAGGTLFLDEIGELPIAMQTSLLRVLQEKEIIRLGESRPRKVDVRVLAATNRDLAAEVDGGRFREDLFYRLKVARLHVPALRERRGDIPLLMSAFLSPEHAGGGRHFEISADAMRRIQEYAWPGNVRELKNTAEYLFIHCRSRVVQVGDLPPEIRSSEGDARDIDVASSVLGIPAKGAVNRNRLLSALTQAGGNRTRAAQLLGISRATLYRHMNRLGIESGG